MVNSFFEKIGLDVTAISQSDRLVHRCDEFDSIAYKYKVTLPSRTESICIEDILGYDYDWQYGGDNLLDSFDHYFNVSDRSYNYSTRSNGMLEYSSEEIVDKLAKSFQEDPIDVVRLMGENDEELNFIGNDGRHRFHILKIHYLSEISKATSAEEIERIKRKYTIPVSVRQIDTLASYCSHILLSCLDGYCWIRTPLTDKNGILIATVEYIDKEGQTRKKDVCREDLPAFVEEQLRKSSLRNYEDIVQPLYDELERSRKHAM